MLRTLVVALIAVVATVGALVVPATLVPAVAVSAPAGPASGSPVSAPSASGSPAAPAPLVTNTGFDPAFIVSDNLFYDGDALSAAEVQAFLDEKGPAECAPGATCLKDFRQDTKTRPADAVCSRYQGHASESAAEIVAKVGKACGISQAVLVVLLEKEQSLVDDPAPTERSYAAATGFACPDTAECDTEYAGFYNQVYWGARQLKRYANPPGTDDYFTWIPVGESTPIQYNPDAVCGASPVTVANLATVALYYYTPYQPNAQVLAGRTDDPCGAYGNLNFWRFYGEWFGSPTAGAPPTGEFGAATARQGRVAVDGWAIDPTSQASSSGVRLLITSPSGTVSSHDAAADEPSGAVDGYPLAGTRHGYDASIGVPSSGLYRVCASALPLELNSGSGTSDLGCRVVMVLQPKGQPGARG